MTETSRASLCWQFDAYGTPASVLLQREQLLPEPGPGQALVRLRAIGMNRSEFNYVQGRYLPAREFPSCVGQEAVGDILALGPTPADAPDARPRVELAVGGRVALLPGRVDICAMGCYRDVGLYDQAALVPVPEDYSSAEAAGLWMGVLTMAGALELAGVTPETANGRTVLVTAASSSMGVVALKLARAWGATTIATSRNAAKAERLAGIADHAFVATDSNSLAAGVREASGDRGFDAALDPVGAAFYPGLLESATHGAHIVSYELITGGEPVLPIARVMIRDLTIRGYTIFRALRDPLLLERILDWGMEYASVIRPIVAGTRSLADAPAALEELGRAEHLGKLILVP